MNSLSKVFLKCATLAARPANSTSVYSNRRSTILSLKIIHPNWATTPLVPLNATQVCQITPSEMDSKIRDNQFVKDLFASTELAPSSPKGIPNLGNTCFIASVIQASLVFQTSELEEKLKTANGNDKAIIQQLLSFVKSYNGPQNSVDLVPILDVLRNNKIYDGNQEDAAELLTWFANFLPNPSVYFKQIFKTAPLKEGERMIEDEENRSQLVREVPLEIERTDSMQMKPGQTILGLLKNFFTETPVENFIQRCVEDSEGNFSERQIPLLSRREILSEAPKTLTIQIKKFHQNRETGQIHRISGQLEDVPETFTMPNEYCANGESATYRLRSAVCHYGNSIESGHYVAFVRKEDNYYRADDGQISKIDRTSMLEAAKQGYILIYDKVVQQS